MSYRTALASVSIVAICACADTTPARIDVTTDALRISAKAPVSVGARLLNKSGSVLSQPKLSYSATPSAVLQATSDGRVACIKTGEGTVIVAGGGQSASVTVQCKLVARIQGPTEMRLIVGRAPEPIALKALDDAGSMVTDPEYSIESSNPRTAKVDRGGLIGAGIGEATVTARAGDASLPIHVTVVELIESNPLAMADGASTTIALQQGTYELDINVKADDGAKDGVKVSWVGTDCPDEKEAREHHVRCVVRQTASLTIKNPTTFGLGATLHGFLNLYKGSR